MYICTHNDEVGDAMSDEAVENMVLRTVFLPPSLDQTLRVAAFVGDSTKNDVIREILEEGVKRLVKAGDKRFAAQTMAVRAKPVPVTAPKTRLVQTPQAAAAPAKVGRVPSKSSSPSKRKR